MPSPRSPTAEDVTAPAGHVRPVLAVLTVIAVYYAIQIATLLLAIVPRLDLPAESRSPGSWLVATEHHLLQLACALILILILGSGRWREWGINLDERKESLRIVGRFCWIYGVYFVGGGFLIQLLFIGPRAPDHPLTASHIIGWLFFGFVLVGVSEEILFRGLFHTWLARSWTGVVRIRSIEMPTAGIAAALVFTLAHVGIRFTTLEVTDVDPLQLAQALVLGLFYSWAYHRTGSLLAPILAHNFSDGMLWAADYLLIGIHAAGGGLPA